MDTGAGSGVTLPSLVFTTVLLVVFQLYMAFIALFCVYMMGGVAYGLAVDGVSWWKTRKLPKRPQWEDDPVDADAPTEPPDVIDLAQARRLFQQLEKFK